LSSSAVRTSGVRSRFADCRLPGTLIDLRAGLEDFVRYVRGRRIHIRGALAGAHPAQFLENWR
jgi:hypothetical protein